MTKRFHELDALRGFAALAVVIYHYSGHADRYHEAGWYFTPGVYGVQLFFLVSGFVIYFTLERSRTLADFAFSRFSRLYPTYWTALALWGAVSVLIVGNALWVGGYAVNATMWQKFLGFEDIDIVFWTLAVELVFYVWMAAIFRAGMLRHIVPIALVWVAGSAAWVMAGRPETLATYLILPHIPYFVAGMMFYLIRRDGAKREYVEMILLALAAAALVDGLPGAVSAAVILAIFALAVAGRLRWAVNPVTLWLGAISYALYVTHRNLGYVALNAAHEWGWNPTAAIVTVTGVALVIASGVTYGIERPAMRALRDWWATSAPLRKALAARESTQSGR